MSDTVSSQSTALTVASPALANASPHKAARRRVQVGLSLAVVDVMSAELSMGIVSWLRSGFDKSTSVFGLDRPAVDLGTWGIVISCFLIVNGCMGLYDTAAGEPVERFRRRVLGTLLVPGPALVFIALFRQAPLFVPLPLSVIVLLLTAAPLALPFGLIGEACLRRVSPEGWNASTLLVGDGAIVNQLASYFAARPELGLRPIGFVSDHPAGAPASLPWIGRLPDLSGLVEGMDVVVIALSGGLSALSPTCLPVRRVMIVSDSASAPSMWFTERYFGDVEGFEFFNHTQSSRSIWIKRGLELCIAIPLGLLSFPLIGLVALAIKLISRGPALYVQKRIGWKGTPIAIYKLRSMHLDADARLQEVLIADPDRRREWERFMKLSRDPRILPYIGSLIRKTSIDELPQLWAVIRGDLSLVGPRPLPSYHLEKFGLQFQRLRASVRPGLTGLWQVSDRSNADLREQEKIDTFYIRYWSLWLDAYIVMRTIPAVFRGRGAC